MSNASPSPSAATTKLIRLIKFGMVGSLGFLWDSGTVYALRPLIGLTAATLVAYFVAATLNWVFNRIWTFKGAGHHEHPVLQWLRFLSANSLGFSSTAALFTCFSIFFRFACSIPLLRWPQGPGPVCWPISV